MEDEALENLAEHLGVDGDIHIQRGVFPDGEVVGLEEVVKNMSECLVAYAQLMMAADSGLKLFGAELDLEKAEYYWRSLLRSPK